MPYIAVPETMTNIWVINLSENFTSADTNSEDGTIWLGLKK